LGFGGGRVCAVWVAWSVSGSFGCGSRGEAARAFAQDDGLAGARPGAVGSHISESRCGAPGTPVNKERSPGTLDAAMDGAPGLARRGVGGGGERQAIPSVGNRNRERETRNALMEQNQTARRTEDIALDLLKFVATTANVGGKTAGSTTGFGVPSSAKPEDQVTSLLELYAKCRQAVEAPLED